MTVYIIQQQIPACTKLIFILICHVSLRLLKTLVRSFDEGIILSQTLKMTNVIIPLLRRYFYIISMPPKNFSSSIAKVGKSAAKGNGMQTHIGYGHLTNSLSMAFVACRNEI